MKVKPTKNTVLCDGLVSIDLRMRQRWTVASIGSRVVVYKDFITLEMSMEQFEKYFSEVSE